MVQGRKPKKQLTPLELRIMQILWDAGPSPVQLVQERLGDDLAYTTVQTMLNVMQRKGHVARSLVGRAFEYRPLHSRDVAMGSAVRDLLNRMFDGSVESLVMNMVRTKQIDSAKLAALVELVASAEGDSDGDRK
ncbi:MAG: BlaI/MecI/CopY family transcriptional regulator [Terracidiphilus sp.]